MTNKITGRFVLPNGSIETGSIFFNETTGLITEINSETIEPNENELIFSGFGDIHIHAREDVSQKHIYKEDFSSAGYAALHGGCVHIADMPNNPVPPIDDTSYEDKNLLTSTSPIHITLYAGIGPTTYPLQRKVPYKVFMGPSIGELFFQDHYELEKVIQRYEGQYVSFHCEDPEILTEHATKEFHEEKRPAIAEIKATEIAIYLIEKYHLKGKLCHYSTGDGLKKIIEAKKRKIDVTCEVTPTHLFFDKTMLTTDNRSWFQMNPPLRDPSDKIALLTALKNGDIDFLATDHAPHSIEEKLKGISGISQLDTFGGFVTWLLKEKNVSVEIINNVCSLNPGKFVQPFLPIKYGKGFGEIAEGFSASFTTLKLNQPWTVSKKDLKTKSGWSPFENYTFPGQVGDIWFHGKNVSK